MTRVRDDPRVRRIAFWADVRRAVFTGILAAAVAYAAANLWPAEWTEPDEQTRDFWSDLVVGVLLVLTAWWVLSALVEFVRWRRDRRWERMLDDPQRAHLVPPLATHVGAVRSPAKGWVLLTSSLLVGLAAVATIGYGTLALTGQVDPVESDGSDVSGNLVFVGALLAYGSYRLFRGFQKARVARQVEQLSNDARLVDTWAPPAVVDRADASETPAAMIPPLDFAFSTIGGWPIKSSHRWSASGEPPSVLYLRLFDNEAGTKRFLEGQWTRIAYVYVLRSASQVSPEELEEAMDSGSVASMFIASAEQLDDALRRQRTGKIDRPRPAKGLVAKWRWVNDSERGRYPVRALLCHGSYWRTAVDLLLERMDFVVLELSGYTSMNAGTAFELQRVIDRFPIERVTLLADYASDERFLTAQVAAMWRLMPASSPNATPTPRRVAFIIDDAAIAPTRR